MMENPYKILGNSLYLVRNPLLDTVFSVYGVQKESGRNGNSSHFGASFPRGGIKAGLLKLTTNLLYYR